MRIVADQNIPALDDTFGRLAEIVRMEGRSIEKTALQDADALLVRSVTRVDQSLLNGTSVRFVGSATIGMDHLDTSYLDRAGITWCHAPGCNADAAAQYTLAMILLATKRCGLDLANMQAGIVGLGNVGSRLQILLKKAGVENILACDPPLRDAGQTGLVNLDEIAQCNLVSFHVPLTRTGPYPSYHMANQYFFEKLPTGALLVNSARGEVLDADALAEWLRRDRGHLALDVWPEEPRIEAKLLQRTVVATPHVAGYSLEGKLNGTRMLFRQYLSWQGKPIPEPLPPFPPPAEPLPAASPDSMDIKWQDLLINCCLTERDDLALREVSQPTEGVSPQNFDRLRKHYPPRRDFAGRAIPDNYPDEISKFLKLFGFAF